MSGLTYFILEARISYYQRMFRQSGFEMGSSQMCVLPEVPHLAVP